MVRTVSGLANVRALERGMRLLAAFTPERPLLSLTELSTLSQLDKSTTRRLLHTLMASGFVTHDAEAERYGLTARILMLASAVATGADLRAAGQPLLHALTAQTGATSFLWVHQDGTALCLARAIARLPEVDAIWFAVGACAALNAGAGPRALLSFIADTERRRALAMPFDVRTPRAEADPARLQRQAQAIRMRGWEFAEDDFVIGLAGLGVPILSADGRLLGALSISGVTSQFGDRRNPFHLATLQHAAATIAARMERPSA